MLPLVCGWEHYPQNKGFVTGIIVGAYGFSSFIFNPLITFLVNPNNESATIKINDDLKFFDTDVADNVPKSIRTVGFIWAALVLASILLISRPPLNVDAEEDDGEEIQADSQISEPTRIDTNTNEILYKYELKSLSDCFHSYRFW